MPNTTILRESTSRKTVPPCPSQAARRSAGRQGVLLLLTAAILIFASGDAKPVSMEPADATEQGEPAAERGEYTPKRIQSIPVSFKKMTPTAEELAAIMYAVPADAGSESARQEEAAAKDADAVPETNAVPAASPASAVESMSTGKSSHVLTPDAEPVSVPTSYTESAPVPTPDANPVPVLEPASAVREEDWMVFQGRSIRITPEAQWCGYKRDDFVWDGDRVRYTGSDYDAVFGIDVSRYHNEEHPDGRLDWVSAREDGVEFAMIRAGGRGTSAGRIYEDNYFAVNVEDAHAAGILTGAYFYSQAVSVAEALEEAEFMLARMEGLPIDGPVCYDWELPDRSSRAWNVSPETATAAAAAFCDRIAQAGYTPMIYESKEVGYLKYDQAALDQYMRWYPQYPSRKTAHPYPEFRYHMELWQFSDRCTVAGIGKRTDGSLWLKPKAAE